MRKFLIADDHPLFREALKAAMQSHFTGVNYLESDSFSTTLNTLRRQRNVSLLLLDLNMPGCDNFYGLLRIRQNFPDLPIAIVSGTEDIDTIAQAMEFGANAFIPKTTATTQMVAALKLALSGGTWVPPSVDGQLQRVSSDKVQIAEKVRELTPKQFTVLRLVKQGLMNKDIAQRLNVTEATVKAHVSALFRRLEVKSRTQILVAIEKLKLD
jgi:DNA-binding NarL/FixJ family response regulator